jgi:sugar O-acyltransferase (sialic acid O-acetyltransferase NeuD family)
MPGRKKLLILGAGRLAMDVADLIDDIPEFEIVGFVTNMPPYEHNTKLLGKQVYWVDDLDEVDHSCLIACAIGTTKRFAFIEQVEKMGFTAATIIHPSARISKTAKIGPGTIVNAGVQVATQAVVNRHIILNRGALIGPFVVIHDYAYIAPGANLAANVTVGRRTWVGLGVNVLEYMKIGEQCMVGAGTLVNKDIPDRVKAVGIPAQIVEREIEGF